MADKNKARELFAQLVLQNKGVLFGAFSTTITHDLKRKAWEEIRQELINSGALHFSGKNADDLRGLFTDMKRRTLDKKHKSETTGKRRVVLTTV